MAMRMTKLVVKTVKVKGMKRVRELARVKELSESGKKFEMTKIEVGPMLFTKS